jgi:4,5-DOPA dioxygenase extradiol
MFISHGAPTLALEDQHPWSKALEALGQRMPRPRAALVVSAHWQEQGGFVTSGTARPETVHDFGGFPDALYRIEYPAPGDPQLARTAADRLVSAGLPAGVDAHRGLDHGAWVPLRRLYPKADVPVVQVALPWPARPEDLLKAGEALRPLRDEGVLLIGSGGATHNLRRLRWDDPASADPEPFAAEFDQWLWQAVQKDDRAALASWQKLPTARLSHPTSEHFEPVLFAVGAADALDAPHLVHHSFAMGSLSLRSFALGAV